MKVFGKITAESIGGYDIIRRTISHCIILEKIGEGEISFPFYAI